MASATFDTLHAAKALTAAGFEAQQAEAITDTIREAFTESVATKADIAGLEAAVTADIAEVKAELKADIAEVRTEIAEVKAELKADIAEVKAELKADIAEVRTEIAEVKTEIAELKAELKADIAGIYKQNTHREWLVALGIVTAVAAIVKLL